jgi:hypothetical protein
MKLAIGSKPSLTGRAEGLAARGVPPGAFLEGRTDRVHRLHDTGRREYRRPAAGECPGFARALSLQSCYFAVPDLTDHFQKFQNGPDCPPLYSMPFTREVFAKTPGSWNSGRP